MLSKTARQTMPKPLKSWSAFAPATATILALSVSLVATSLFGGDDFETPNAIDPLSTGSINPAEVTPSYANPIKQLFAKNMGGRRYVAPNEKDFNAIGKLKIGNGHCSGQYTKFSGYSQISEGMLISDAGHCILDQDPKDINFTTMYIDAKGIEQTFTTNVTPQVWVNDSYAANHVDGEYFKVSKDDNALLFFPNQKIPSELKPLDQYVFSYHMGEYNNNKIAHAKISVAGYAADLGSELTTDDNCQTQEFLEGFPITTNCVTNVGGSGGALLGRDESGKTYNLAVVSGVTVGPDKEANIFDEDFKSILAPFYHHQLADIPFLKKDDVCAKLTADGVNLREYADIGSEPNGPSLPFNDNAILKVVSMLKNEQAKISSENVWVEVTKAPEYKNYKYERDGYIRADMLKPTPCPS